MNKEPSIRKQKAIEAQFESDIAWAIDKGPGWEPDKGVEYNCETKKWEGFEGCGVCAVGAHVLRHRTKPRKLDSYRDWFEEDVSAASRSLGVSEAWLSELYIAVCPSQKEESAYYSYPSAYSMGRRLVAFAEHYQAKRDAYKAK